LGSSLRTPSILHWFQSGFLHSKDGSKVKDFLKFQILQNMKKKSEQDVQGSGVV
jgi:hypothetical protein